MPSIIRIRQTAHEIYFSFFPSENCTPRRDAGQFVIFTPDVDAFYFVGNHSRLIEIFFCSSQALLLQLLLSSGEAKSEPDADPDPATHPDADPVGTLHEKKNVRIEYFQKLCQN